MQNRMTLVLVALLALSFPPSPARSATPPSGPLGAGLAPGIQVADAPAGLALVVGLTEGGAHIDTTRLEVTATGWEHPVLLTLAPGVRGGQLAGGMTLHNGTGRPLGGVRLDLTGIDELFRGDDGVAHHRARVLEPAEALFFGDVGRGADTPEVPFSFGPVAFAPETIRLELYLRLSGYRLEQVLFSADSLTVAADNPGEGLDAPPRRIRAGDLFETLGFSRCACQIDTIRAQDGTGHDMVTPPLRAGAALGGLNKLTACDVGRDGHLYVVDREFAVDDSSHAPLARVSCFDRTAAFVTAFGWGGRDAVPPYANSGRLLEPDGISTLGDGRLAVRTRVNGRQRARIHLFAPFAPPAKVIPPR